MLYLVYPYRSTGQSPVPAHVKPMDWMYCSSSSLILSLVSWRWFAPIHANVPPYIRRCHGCHLAVFAVLLTCPEYPSSSMGCCRPQPQIATARMRPTGSLPSCFAMLSFMVLSYLLSLRRSPAQSLDRWRARPLL